MGFTEPNLYPTTVKKEDADSTRVGKWKTRIYILVLLVTVACVALFNGTRSTVVSKTLGSAAAPIKATQFDEIKDKDPNCPCTRSQISIGDFVDVDLKIDELCDVRLPEDNPTPMRFMGVGDPVTGVNQLCDLAVNQHAAKLKNINASQLANPTVLSRSNLNESVRVLVQNTIRNTKSEYGLMMASKSLFDKMQKPFLMTEWALQSKRVSGLAPRASTWAASRSGPTDWVTTLMPRDNQRELGGTNKGYLGYTYISSDNAFNDVGPRRSIPGSTSIESVSMGQPSCSVDWAKNTTSFPWVLNTYGGGLGKSGNGFSMPTGRCKSTFPLMWEKKSAAEQQQTYFVSTCDTLQRTLNMQTAFYAECESIQVLYFQKTYGGSDGRSGDQGAPENFIVPKVKPGAYPTVGEAANNAFLDPSAGVRKIHFDKYFSTCAPTTCTYTEIRPPSIGELILLTVALVGGLNGLIKLAVGAFVDAVELIRKKKNTGDAATDPEAPTSSAEGKTDASKASAIIPVNEGLENTM